MASGASAESIAAIDPDNASLQRTRKRFGIDTANTISALSEANPSWRDASDGSLGIVIAVKPNIVRAVCEELAAADFTGQPAILSVAAGVRCDSLQQWLGECGGWSVMRCMPNTPALVGKGASALYVASASEAQHEAALSLLNAVGTVVTVDEEAHIDAVTALSGSGPAYVFRLAELMIENGIALGLDPEQARELGIATIEGAAAMLTHGGETPTRLRENVTSPGGTTAAALEQFTASGLDQCIGGGMRAALDRAQAMGDSLADPNHTH